MQCWKSINLNKIYGTQRIVIISLLIMLLSFISLYTIISMGITADKLKDDYDFYFLCSLFMLYPLHKMLHLLPLLFVAKKVKVKHRRPYKFLPVLDIKVKDPISKWLFITTLLTPFVVITSILLFYTTTQPAYSHYLTILLSIHIGICVPDLLTFRNVLHSPQNSYVEENEEGFKILISKP
ncbi:MULTISPECIES: DUF3267 domain-containing protein [Bacillus]|uniref:DUF3267 domain-containing protein n=1 Tax=Bacillus TaxID=1386 RepID=UPI0002ED1271|nr:MULTISPECIES: DUF3267 domain-containing protein [Bacillus]